MLLALCEGNSLVTGEFPAQSISNAEKASIWWRHHELTYIPDILLSLSGIITLFITKNVEIDDWEYLYHHVNSTDSGAAFIYYTFEDIIIQRHRVIKTNLRCKFCEPIEGGRRQDIICTNIGILLIWTLGINISEILSEISYIFIQVNAFENFFWKMATSLSRPQCVKAGDQAWYLHRRSAFVICIPFSDWCSETDFIRNSINAASLEKITIVIIDRIMTLSRWSIKECNVTLCVSYWW